MAAEYPCRLGLRERPQKSDTDCAPEKRRKTAADASKDYRRRMKESPGLYRKFRKFETVRVKHYIAGISAEKRAQYNEKARLRMQKYRERKRAEGLLVTPRSKTRSEKEKQRTKLWKPKELQHLNETQQQSEKEKQRTKWRKEKERQHLNETQQQRDARNAQRRRLYAARKAAKEKAVKKSESKEKRKERDQEESQCSGYENPESMCKTMYQTKKCLPSDCVKKVPVMEELVMHATPQSKKMCHSHDMLNVVSPNSKRRLAFMSSLQLRESNLNAVKTKRNKVALQQRRSTVVSLGTSVLKKYTVKQARHHFGNGDKPLKKIKTSKCGSDLGGRKTPKDAVSDESKSDVEALDHCQDISRSLPDGKSAKRKRGKGKEFLSLGPRESFEIAHIRPVLETCSTQRATCDPTSFPQSIDMDRLRQNVDSMGDAVSDRAKAFLTTLENFHKSKQGTVDDLRHLLLDKNQESGDAQSMAGIASLLTMFAASPGKGVQDHPVGASQSEGSMMNNMLTQMASSFGGMSSRQGDGAGQAAGSRDVYGFLHSMCSQVADMRVAGEQAPSDSSEGETSQKEQSAVDRVGGGTEELEKQVAAQVDAIVETRLTAVEEQLKQQVDQRIDELETRMSSKLDAIFALLQDSKKQ